MNDTEDDRVRSWNRVWDALVSHNPAMAQKDGAGVDNAVAEIHRLQSLDERRAALSLAGQQGQKT